eukprot:603232_1
MAHPTKQSVHYQGLAWANKGNNNASKSASPPPKAQNQNQQSPTSPSMNRATAQQHQQQYGANTYTARGNNPMASPQNNNAFPTAAQRQQQMMQQRNFAQSQRTFGPSANQVNQQGMNRQPNAQMMNRQQLGVSQSMTPQQMRNSMNPQQMSAAQARQMQMQQQQRGQSMRNSMQPQHNIAPSLVNNNSKGKNKTKTKTKDKKKKKKKKKDGQSSKKAKAASGNNLQPNQRGQHFQSHSAGNVGNLGPNRAGHVQSSSSGAMKTGPPPTQGQRSPMVRQANQQQRAGPNQRAMSPNQRVQIQQNANVKPGQLTMQQMQQMNAANMRQQQMMRQRQAQGQGNQYQRQVKRNYPQGAWGPSHPYYKMQQRQMMMARQAQGQGRGRGNPYAQQWQQYYQRMMQNPQGQLQQMVMQQQQMIGNLKRQLQERDKHYHKTIQTTINFKDMEINELRKQITKLDEENEAIGELQMQNFKMKQELNNLRGDHQSNVFDNLLSNMNLAKGSNAAKVEWPGGVPVPPPPSTTAPAVDPKAAALNAIKSEEMLLVNKSEEYKREDDKDSGKYAKYAKMKKIGMPMVSIVNKMRMDGMSTQEIEEYTGECVGGSEEQPKPAGPKINLADPKFAKYHRMKKLNMPIKSIVNKMRLDGCSQAEQDAMAGKSGAPSKPDRKKQKMNEMRQLAETMGLNPISESLPSKVPKLKRIHWILVELSALRKTYWWQINHDTNLPEHIDLGGKFELDFQVRQRKPRLNHAKQTNAAAQPLVVGSSGKKGKREQICWIAAKRDQSIQIALKRIGLPNEVLYDAIVDMDEEVVTLDVLEVVWEIVPSTDEAAFAETKAEELREELDRVGISEMFHIEMSTIPEVKEQVSKWLFARTFREVYMDRLGQVNTMTKCANLIKHSVAFQTYLRIVLSMGNLMNHGTLKGMAYGFKLDSVVKLLAGIKDYGGNKDLAMFLYQFAYNAFPATRSIFTEFDGLLKKAVRLEVTTIESSIVKMADEFVAIDLFLRRLTDDFHPEDTERFREYMIEFQEKQESDMMNLKVKIQNGASICEQTAKFYSIDLEEGKPESIFRLVKQFLDILDNAKRALLKLEKERIKQEQRAAREAAKRRKTMDRKNMSVEERMKSKQQRMLAQQDQGNLLFLDIKNAADAFAQRQDQMAQKLESTLKEKRAAAQGKVTKSVQNDAIKRRVSAQVCGGGGDNAVGGLDMDEINRLRAINDDEQFMTDDLGMMAFGQPQPMTNDIGLGRPQQQQNNEEEEEEDIDVQQQQNNVDLHSAQWDDDDF